jgi:hypothetical protein
MLKNAVSMHGGKDWAAIAAMVPGRTKSQCYQRWHYALDPSIDQANSRTGKWTADEDTKLQGAVQTHGARIGPQLPLWFRVEQQNRVGIDGSNT